MKRCLAMLVLGAAAAHAQDEERPSRAYDIWFLTQAVENFKGPSIGLGYEDLEGFGIGVTGGVEEGRAPVTEEFLVGAIKANFDEDSWSDERNSIEYRSGVLYVTQTKAIHEKIAAYLEMLRRRFSRRVVIESEVLLVAPEAFAASGAMPGVLTPEQEKALHDAAADPARGRLLTFLRTVATNGQRVYAADLHEKSYVRDYDVEIAIGQAIADPVSGNLTTGTVLDVRPVLANDMATLLLETRFQMSRPRAMTAFEPGTAVLGTIQLPSQDVLRSKTTLALAVGRTALLCAGPLAGEKDWIGAVLVKPTLTGSAGGDDTASTEKRQMRMYDVSSLTAAVRDFPGPSLAQSTTSMAGGAPTTTFVPPEDEGMGLSPEQLVEAIRSNVARDSWKNSRNRLELMGDQIIAVQTPDVLEEIAKFVAVAAPARNRLIGVEAVVVGLDAASWAARRAALGGASPSEDALKDLLAAAAKGGAVRVVTSARGAGMSGQRFYVHAGSEQAFVQDDDVEIAEGVAASDPVVGDLTTGCVLDVRATLAGDGRKLQLELRPQYYAAADPETLDPKAPNVGRIQKLRTSSFRVQTDMFVPDGSWTLAGVATTNAGGRRETLAMLVKARSMEVK